MCFCGESDLLHTQQTDKMKGENKAVNILPRMPPAERAVSLCRIITFHPDDNGGMSARAEALLCVCLHCY